MPEPVTQAGRVFAIETPLAFDTLLIDSFTGTEGISRPFHFEVELLADIAFNKHLQVKPEELIGHKMCITIDRKDGPRFIHAICKSLGVTGIDARFAHFKAELVPWFALLGLNSDCRFFQNMSVPDIVEKVFNDLGYQDYRLEVSRSYTPWDYCCQYRETDFNFISRLLEAEGIFYYFEHAKDKHTLVLTDSLTPYKDMPLQPFCDAVIHGAPVTEEDGVFSFTSRFDLKSSEWTARDFHFEKPRSSFEVTAPALRPVDSSKHLKMFDFPGGYAQKFNETSARLGKIPEEGDALIKLQAQGDESSFETFNGVSNVRALLPGFRLEIKRLPKLFENDKYVITSVSHLATQAPAYLSDEQVGLVYQNSFTCIPDKVAFAPPAITPKPMIQGPQNAFVVDENVTSESSQPKEEIWPDKFGRVRVRFPWDRDGKFACWLRVAQQWAGRGWGYQWIPRTGDEVLVDFIEGDPDCPIVIGSLYNTDNMPPFKLPDKKTQSGIVTRSTREGTAKNFNMLRFDDDKGKEQVLIRSQKRGDIRVLGSMFETIHGNRNLIVGFPDGTEKGGALTITVGGTNDNHVEGDRFTNIDGTETLVVGGNVMHDFQADYTCLTAGKLQLNAPEITIEASTKIGLTVGGNSIVIDKSGVTIVGMMVKINSGGAGPFVMAPNIQDALDAAESDPGDPGWKPRTGGSGKGRNSRSPNVHHAISKPVTRRADGKLQVGNGIVIDGDKDFEEKVLRDLSRMDTTTTGKDRIDRIEAAGKGVTIKEGPSNATTFNNWNDGAAAGKPDVNGNPGTGNGTGSTITYNPDKEPPTAANPNVNRPADVALNHEMSHAVHGAEGTDDNSPDPANPKNPSVEETQTINEDNKYRDERGIPRRADHTVL